MSLEFRQLSTVRWEPKGTFGFLTLNRPEVRNALNPKMIEELTLFFSSIQKDRGLRSIVLRGEGASFCAGADLEWMKSMKSFSRQENLEDSNRLSNMFLAMQNCELPIIGSFHGALMGGALGLASLCDLAAARMDTQFAFSEVRLGIAPAVISPFVFSKVSVGAARPWILTGSRFGVEEAKKMNLIQMVGEQTDVDQVVQSWVKQFESLPPRAPRMVKQMLNPANQQKGPDYFCEMIADLRVSEEGQEGLASFLEKRAPNWPELEGED